MLRAHGLWLYAEGYSRAVGRPIDRHSRVLDIGCGWGRITRTFARDVPRENLFGVDIDPSAITISQYLGVPAQFALTRPGEPLPFPDNFFNVISANSVFTHLPENVTTALLAEMKRVTAPGGLMVFTVEDESFFNYFDVPGIENANERWRLLSRYKSESASLRARAAAGEYIYLTTNRESIRSAEVYGDAVIPLAWIERNCGRYFKLLRFEPTSPPIYQAVVVGIRME